MVSKLNEKQEEEEKNANKWELSIDFSQMTKACNQRIVGRAEGRWRDNTFLQIIKLLKLIEARK